MSKQTLNGSTALITGAGSGIGRALSLSLAARGANIVASVRRGFTGEETARLVAAEGGSARWIEADCSDYSAIADAVKFTKDTFGGLDIMIHNAVYAHGQEQAPIETFTDEIFDRMVSVCLTGAYNCAHAAFPLLKESRIGRYIAMTSNFGLHGAGIDPGYAATKSGTRGFVKALAREWGPYGITVNAISPAALSEAAEEWFGENPEIKKMYYRKYPLGQIGRPREDIADAIAALCTEDFSYMTGQTIVLDGGMYTGL